MLVTFRITLEYIKENIDVVQFLKQYGTDLFLVLHKKPNNYHYHGLLDINITARSFRDKIKEMLCPHTTNRGGLRPFTVSDKVEDSDRYKSYCLYRPGHPIDAIHVTSEVANLGATEQKRKNELKQEVELREVLHLVKDEKSIYEISRLVCKYYKDNGKVVHITKMQQLIHTVNMYIKDDVYDLAEHLINSDEGLQSLHQRELRNINHKKGLGLVIDSDEHGIAAIAEQP